MNRQFTRTDTENMLLCMADIVEENRKLRVKIAEYQMRIIKEDARLYGKHELVEKVR